MRFWVNESGNRDLRIFETELYSNLGIEDDDYEDRPCAGPFETYEEAFMYCFREWPKRMVSARSQPTVILWKHPWFSL